MYLEPISSIIVESSLCPNSVSLMCFSKHTFPPFLQKVCVFPLASPQLSFVFYYFICEVVYHNGFAFLSNALKFFVP